MPTLSASPSTSPEGSITLCLDLLKHGDRAAAQPLWEAYFRRLVGLARSRLGDVSRRVADEEDVALSAFDSFIRGAEHGRFPRLEDREDLWQLLFVITVRKVSDHRRRESRPTRGGGRVRTISDLAEADLVAGLGREPEPTPEFVAEFKDECRHRLNILGDPQLRTVALMKLEGYTHKEIGARLGWLERKLERKVKLIRILWGVEDTR